MARYKVRYTIYKDPTGKTMMGPTVLHFLGDLASGFGLIGILGAILAVMEKEKYGTPFLIGCVVTAVAGFVLMVVFHKMAKKSAEAKFLKVLAQQEGHTMTQSRD